MSNGARRLGIIEISSSTALSAELPHALPPDVLGVVARLRLPRQEVSIAALDEMLSGEALELAAAQLGDANVGLISFACTSGSFLHGASWDQQLAQRVERASGVPATTTSSAVIAALRSLGASRIAVGSPYPDELNRLEARFLESAGFDVVRIEGLGLTTDGEIGALTGEVVRNLAHAATRDPSDVLFLSCTNMSTLRSLDEIADLVGRPVVSSNSATVWDGCRRLGAIPQNDPHRVLWRDFAPSASAPKGA